MNETLKRLEEKYGFHDLGTADDPVAGPDGCLAFVIDSRCVIDAYGELRLAVSYGDNPFPPERGQCVMSPRPMAGAHCFLIHVVGTEGKYLRVYDMRYDGREAAKPLSPVAATLRAKEILASITDDEYLRIVSDKPMPPEAKVSVSEPRPLEDYTSLYDAEEAPAEEDATRGKESTDATREKSQKEGELKEAIIRGTFEGKEPTAERMEKARESLDEADQS